MSLSATSTKSIPHVTTGANEKKDLFYNNGTLWCRQYFLNGYLHRLDGPAEENYYESGALRSRIWCLNGQRHRLDGPAVERFHKDGIIVHMWWQHGQLHRLDGPAVEQFDDSGQRAAAEYWLNDERLTETKHRQRVALTKLVAQTLDVRGVSL